MELGRRSARRNIPRGGRLLEDTALRQRGEGRDFIANNWAEFSSVFPNAHFEVEGAVCDDDGYAIQWRWTGVYKASGRSSSS
jgi:hypothetical protein